MGPSREPSEPKTIVLMYDVCPRSSLSVLPGLGVRDRDLLSVGPDLLGVGRGRVRWGCVVSFSELLTRFETMHVADGVE